MAAPVPVLTPEDVVRLMNGQPLLVDGGLARSTAGGAAAAAAGPGAAPTAAGGIAAAASSSSAAVGGSGSSSGYVTAVEVNAMLAAVIDAPPRRNVRAQRSYADPLAEANDLTRWLAWEPTKEADDEDVSMLPTSGAQDIPSSASSSAVGTPQSAMWDRFVEQPVSAFMETDEVELHDEEDEDEEEDDNDEDEEEDEDLDDHDAPHMDPEDMVMIAHEEGDGHGDGEGDEEEDAEDGDGHDHEEEEEEEHGVSDEEDGEALLLAGMFGDRAAGDTDVSTHEATTTPGPSSAFGLNPNAILEMVSALVTGSEPTTPSRSADAASLVSAFTRAAAGLVPPPRAPPVAVTTTPTASTSGAAAPATPSGRTEAESLVSAIPADHFDELYQLLEHVEVPVIVAALKRVTKFLKDNDSRTREASHGARLTAVLGCLSKAKRDNNLTVMKAAMDLLIEFASNEQVANRMTSMGQVKIAAEFDEVGDPELSAASAQLFCHLSYPKPTRFDVAFTHNGLEHAYRIIQSTDPKTKDSTAAKRAMWGVKALGMMLESDVVQKRLAASTKLLQVLHRVSQFDDASISHKAIRMFRSLSSIISFAEFVVQSDAGMEALQALRQHKDDNTRQATYQFFNSIRRHSPTLKNIELIQWASAGHINNVKALHSMGADVNCTVGQMRARAAMACHKLLPSSLNSQPSCTPLLAALLARKADVALFLLEQGADATRETDKSETCLQLAQSALSLATRVPDAALFARIVKAITAQVANVYDDQSQAGRVLNRLITRLRRGTGAFASGARVLASSVTETDGSTAIEDSLPPLRQQLAAARAARIGNYTLPPSELFA